MSYRSLYRIELVQIPGLCALELRCSNPSRAIQEDREGSRRSDLKRVAHGSLDILPRGRPESSREESRQAVSRRLRGDAETAAVGVLQVDKLRGIIDSKFLNKSIRSNPVERSTSARSQVDIRSPGSRSPRESSIS